MRRPAARFPIALALGAVTVAPWPNAQAQDAREGLIEIEKCQTISQPGSYKLVNNLTFTGTTGVCLQITADFVTIDLVGFTITGPGLAVLGAPNTTAIASGHDRTGITVRNGSISGFGIGVNLEGDGSIVEGLRVFGAPGTSRLGIAATGIVKNNTVVAIVTGGGGGGATGISATGIVTGNYVTGTRATGISIGQGSTVIGNTVTDTFSGDGILVACPSNVTDNTAVNNPAGNIVLNGNGCNNTNNVAP
jgi:hypothetical protein